MDAINSECVRLYTVFVPLSAIRLAIGYPMIMKLIRENPDTMKYTCGIVAEDEKALERGVIREAGADGSVPDARQSDALCAMPSVRKATDARPCHGSRAFSRYTKTAPEQINPESSELFMAFCLDESRALIVIWGW